MNLSATPSSLARPHSPQDEIAGLLVPGVVTLDSGGAPRFADPRAQELLGCAAGPDLERLWADLKPRLQEAGMSWNGAESATSWTALDLPAGGAARRLLFHLRREPGSGGLLLIQDLGTVAGLEADLKLTSQMRSVAQISPAVAHDLRAPINAMVFNIEILKEMLASGRAADPASRDKLMRYVGVLKDELSRLHRGLETFLAYISPRSDRQEILDLRELADELASLLVAPARKQQVQVKADLPEGAIPVDGNRYLLRQALLHVSLAALAGTPRQGTLRVSLERLDGRARLRVQGEAGPDSPAETEASAPPPGLEGFGLSFSPDGALARLWAARAILAAHGGEAREEEIAGRPRMYEVELTVSGNQSIGNKE
jgi:signal transduction histidine kinase